MSEWQVLVDGLDFGEGPRWHEDRLWYSDFYQETIYAVDADGHREAIVTDFGDRPSGLGWLPDGSLLAVSMTARRLIRIAADGARSVHADLAELAPWHCNDMVVDAAGNAYVGNFGFDLEAGATPVPTTLVLVRPDGTASVAADDLKFPNGSVITPDGSTLVVGESFGRGYEAFTIEADATLSNRRRWADVPGTAPDGCTMDAELGIWFSDAVGSRVLRVLEGGEVTHEIATPQPTFACMLGGPDGITLYALTAAGAHPDEARGSGAGVIYQTTVDVPRAGLP